MCVKSNNPLVIACRQRTGADFWSSACKHHCLSRSCSDTDVGLVQHSVLDTVILQDTLVWQQQQPRVTSSENCLQMREKKIVII